MTEATAKRGPYAKGIAKRQEILREALKAYAESDSAGPSLRAIAARVQLSERGLLHYFASRAELFVSILAERDAAELELIGPDPEVEKLAAIQARNVRTPGLVRLFFEMAAAAPDPDSVAHGFFTGRYARLRAYTERVLRSSAARRNQTLATGDAAFLARILVAASDGLQIQWLLDPSIDMEGDLKRLAEALDIVPVRERSTSARD